MDKGPGDLTIIGIRDIRPQILFSSLLLNNACVRGNIASIFRGCTVEGLYVRDIHIYHQWPLELILSYQGLR